MKKIILLFLIAGFIANNLCFAENKPLTKKVEMPSYISGLPSLELSIPKDWTGPVNSVLTWLDLPC